METRTTKRIIPSLAATVLFLAAGYFLVKSPGADINFVMKSRAEEPKERNINFGFFYFKEYDDPRFNIKASYVRTAISWAVFQPKAPEYDGDGNVNNFKWSNAQEKQIVNLNGAGKKVIPSIRTGLANAKTGEGSWALYPVAGGVRNDRGKPITPKIVCKKETEANYKASALPKDLSPEYNAEHAYSKNYYTFVKSTIKHFKDKGVNFETVVIENEMNSPFFWCGTPDQYIRLFKTAVKAVHDIDPEIKVADGGLQGYVLDNLSRNTEGQGIAFTNGKALVEAEIFGIGDLINFHHYQDSSNIARIINYIKDKSKDTKPVFSNEIGSREGQESGREMVKKVSQLLMMDVSPIIWFSNNGVGEGSNDGALIEDNGQPIERNLKAFAALMNFFDDRVIYKKNLSSPDIFKFSFEFKDKKTTVLWSAKPESAAIGGIDAGCERYDYQGNKITSGSFKLDASPVFEICKNRGQVCSDSTPYNQCSAAKPQFCSQGILKNDCSRCGCPENFSCQNNGNCSFSLSAPIKVMWQVKRDTSDEELKFFQEAGINTIQDSNIAKWKDEEISKYLDLAKKHSMKVMVSVVIFNKCSCDDRSDCTSDGICKTGEGSWRPTKIIKSDSGQDISISDFINKWKNNDAVLAWMTFDEPKIKKVNKSSQEYTYRFIKNIDPVHPIFLNTNINTQEGYDNYYTEKAFDILDIHHYVRGKIEKSQEDLIKFFKANKKSNFPVIITLRAFNRRDPDKDPIPDMNAENSLQKQYDFFIKNSDITDNVGFYGWSLNPNMGINQVAEIKKQFVDLILPSQVCSDSTPYNQCSAVKPQFCDQGILKNDCSRCGCPANRTCQTDGSCLAGNVVVCESFAYSDWSACQPDNTRQRTALSGLPEGCSGGDPVLTESCVYQTNSGGGGGGWTGGDSASGGSAGRFTDANTAVNLENIINANNFSKEVLGDKIFNYPGYSSLYGLNSSLAGEISLSEAISVTSFDQLVPLDDKGKGLYANLMEKGKSKETVSQSEKYALAYFIYYGTPTTRRLGSGERAGVIGSFISANGGNLPRTIYDWQDIIKIAGGRWPDKKSAQAEKKAKDNFMKIFSRNASTNNIDQNAIMIMAYGLRPASRSILKEAAALLTFKNVFKRAPDGSSDWDIVRAIAYSGASK
ncbi:MAG: glycosyl hydrolase 53 family protein [Patescibacteria group bacterium]|jgi:hypothetical protein